MDLAAWILKIKWTGVNFHFMLTFKDEVNLGSLWYEHFNQKAEPVDCNKYLCFVP